MNGVTYTPYNFNSPPPQQFPLELKKRACVKFSKSVTVIGWYNVRLPAGTRQMFFGPKSRLKISNIFQLSGPVLFDNLYFWLYSLRCKIGSIPSEWMLLPLLLIFLHPNWLQVSVELPAIRARTILLSDNHCVLHQ